MATASRKQILVVEDNPPLAKSLQELLELAGFEVHVASSGQSAIRHAAEHRPNLVVLDLRLPDMNGYKVCEQLRRFYHASAVPILMLTGMDQPIDQLRGFAHGADAYLTKPCQPPELIETVRLLLGNATAVGS